MKIREKFYRFMAGRYGGADALNRALLVLVFVLIFARMFIPAESVWRIVLSAAMWLLLGWSFFRMFSRNVTKRVAENYKFTGFFGRIKRFFAGRVDMMKQLKDYCFIKCPSCKKTLRLPRGKGKINVHCRQCGHSFNAKT